MTDRSIILMAKEGKRSRRSCGLEIPTHLLLKEQILHHYFYLQTGVTA
jgi:hypothetical protein